MTGETNRYTKQSIPVYLYQLQKPVLSSQPHHQSAYQSGDDAIFWRLKTKEENAKHRHEEKLQDG